MTVNWYKSDLMIAEKCILVFAKMKIKKFYSFYLHENY